ncbi:endonuclease, partial [Rubrivirga sp.]|uniref:endonuclease n=1 Tax=Rubrivirga sp. TaxID=1885344 RepID=UPI003C76DEB8
MSTVDLRVRLDSTFYSDSTFVPADSTWDVEEWWEVTETPFVAALDDTTTLHRPGALPPDWAIATAEPTATPQAHVVGTPLPADALPSPTGDHLDLHAAWPSTGSGAVLEDRRGDVARAALYVRTVYPLHVEAGLEGAGAEWPASAHALEVDDLLADHAADPPDDLEIDRHDRATALQDNTNPFVTDPSLADRAFPPRPRVDRTAPPLWINEVHATNAGRDVAEGVEVAGPARTDLTGWRLALYGGGGRPYDPYDLEVDATPALVGALPAEGSLGAAWLPVQGMWNRCNGVALFDPDATLVQFVSYGGCQFNAVAGPVLQATEAAIPGAGAPSHPDSLAWTTPARGTGRVPPQEWTQMPAGYSLQLTGAGLEATDFVWGGPHPASPGRLNDYQAPAGDANARTGWDANTPIPPPLYPTSLLYPDLEGAPLRDALRRDFAPTRTLGYGPARDSLYTYRQRTVGAVCGVYTGFCIDLEAGRDASASAHDQGVNAEHIWPQSRGLAAEPQRSDLH